MQVINSTISSDIFTDQVISPVTLIVLAVLSVLLVREWILQHAPRSVFDEKPVGLDEQPVTEEAQADLPVSEDVAAQHVAPGALGCAASPTKTTRLRRIYIARHGLKPNRLGTDW